MNLRSLRHLSEFDLSHETSAWLLSGFLVVHIRRLFKDVPPLRSLYFDTSPDLLLSVSHRKIHESRHDEGFARRQCLSPPPPPWFFSPLSSAFCCHCGPQQTNAGVVCHVRTRFPSVIKRRLTSCVIADIKARWRSAGAGHCFWSSLLAGDRRDERTDSQLGVRRGRNDI